MISIVEYNLKYFYFTSIMNKQMEAFNDWEVQVKLFSDLKKCEY